MAVGVCILSPWPGEVTAQVGPRDPPPASAAGDTVLATPAGRYPAGPIHRWVLGSGHRDLWGLPVPARVLDLDDFAGGLEPERLGGGQQTRSLRFRGADGQTWTFRSIDKDAARTLDPVLRETLAARVLQDQISALFPLGAMVVDPLLDAAGVLHANPELVVIPDDPALGEFREMFAGMLGWMEVRPDEGEDDSAGFAGSERVVSSPRLLERLESGPDNRIDARAFLRARLMDFLLGDWDRHPDQWRWAGFEEEGAWVFQPVPRDRDWALSRLDGAITRVTRVPWPHYVGFDVEYPSAFRISWSGRALDRRLLVHLSWQDWRAVVDDLVLRLDDRVIRGAVARLPEPYLEAEGDFLVTALRSRRDALPSIARDFYELLAGWVDIHTTDEPELARITRLPEGDVLVEIAVLDDGVPGEVFFRRLFLARETREVRLDLHGDEDRVEVTGPPDDRIVIRVDGGGDDDVYVDETGGAGLRLYDHRGDNDVSGAPDARIDRSDWDDPVDAEESTHGAGYRSWGHRWFPVPEVAYSPDLGLFLGAGAERLGYGFRHYPWATRFRVTAGLSTGTGRPDASVGVDVPVWRRSFRASARADLVGARTTRFYGFGNDTDADLEDDAYKAVRREVRLEALLHTRLPGRVDVAGGAYVASLRPDANPGSLVEDRSPYGYRDFDQLGFLARASWDGREEEGDPGTAIAVDVRLHPATLDVVDPFVSARLVAAWRAGAAAGDHRPMVAIRVGGEKLWGTFPYHEAAYIGGDPSLRGYRHQRFAGDASVFLDAEARMFLTEFAFLVPGDLGLLALTDLGRVFMEGESPDGWHGAVGGGVWLSWLDALTVSAAVARGEDTAVYLSLGLPFSTR